MLASYYDACASEMEYDSWVETKMEKQQTETFHRISTIVRKEYIESFAKVLSAAYELQCVEAENIAHDLHLTQSHFLAIDNKFKEFKKYHEENNDWRYV